MLLSSHSLLPASDSFILMVGLHGVGGVNPQHVTSLHLYLHTSLSTFRLAAFKVYSAVGLQLTIILIID